MRLENVPQKLRKKIAKFANFRWSEIQVQNVPVRLKSIIIKAARYIDLIQRRQIPPYDAEAAGNLWFVTASLAAKLRLFRSAFTLLEYYVDLSPRDYIAWYRLGHLYFQRGEIAKGTRIYETLLRESPEDFEFRAEISERISKKARTGSLGHLQDYDASKPIEPKKERNILNPTQAKNKCHFCGARVNVLLFECRHCGHRFCSPHRLPENHTCQGVYRQTELRSTQRARTERDLCYEDPKTIPDVALLQFLETILHGYESKPWHLLYIYKISQSERVALNEALYRIQLDDSFFSSGPDQLWFQLGRAFHKSGEYDNAELVYVAILNRNSSFSPARNNLGILLSARGNPEKAEGIYREIVANHPEQPAAWANLGMLLEDVGRKEEAREIYEEGLRWTPDHPVITQLLQKYKDRDYYIQIHGFDMVSDRKSLPYDPKGYRYECVFSLDQDPLLKQASIQIIARVDVGRMPSKGEWRIWGEKNDGKPHNRIVFKRDDREALVYCIHTAVCTIALDEFELEGDLNEEALLERAISTENRPIELSAEEHFASLKSFVEGIANIGIQNMMLASYLSEDCNPETLPFGFNAMLQGQVIRALRKIAPKEVLPMIREHLIQLSERVPKEWFISRLPILDGIFAMPLSEAEILETGLTPINPRNLLSKYFQRVLFGEVETFQALDEILQSPYFRQVALESPETAMEVKTLISKEIPYDIESITRWINSRRRRQSNFAQCSLQALDFALCFFQGIPSLAMDLKFPREHPYYQMGQFSHKDKRLLQFIPEKVAPFYGWTPVLQDLVENMIETGEEWNGKILNLNTHRLSIPVQESASKSIESVTPPRLIDIPPIRLIGAKIRGWKSIFTEACEVVEEVLDLGGVVLVWVCLTGHLFHIKEPFSPFQFNPERDTAQVLGLNGLTHTVTIFARGPEPDTWMIQDGFEIHPVRCEVLVGSAAAMHITRAGRDVAENFSGGLRSFHIIISPRRS